MNYVGGRVCGRYCVAARPRPPALRAALTTDRHRRTLRAGAGSFTVEEVSASAPAPALALLYFGRAGGERRTACVSYRRYQKIDTGLFILRRAMCGLIRFRMEISEDAPPSKPLSCMFYKMVVATCCNLITEQFDYLRSYRKS